MICASRSLAFGPAAGQTPAVGNRSPGPNLLLAGDGQVQERRKTTTFLSAEPRVQDVAHGEVSRARED